jgi:hypothetical protein
MGHSRGRNRGSTFLPAKPNLARHALQRARTQLTATARLASDANSQKNTGSSYQSPRDLP